MEHAGSGQRQGEETGVLTLGVIVSIKTQTDRNSPILSCADLFYLQISLQMQY